MVSGTLDTMAALRLTRKLAAPLAFIFLVAQLLLGSHAHAWSTGEKAPTDHCLICLVKTAQNGGTAPPPAAEAVTPPAWQIAVGYDFVEPVLPRAIQLSEHCARGPPPAV
jgi:hypothetical protein